MTDLTDDQVRALLKKAGPGPWDVDGPVWNRTVWRSSENRVCFMAHSNGLDDDRDIATSELVAAAPDLARALLQARADAAAAQAAMVERAAENVRSVWGRCEALEDEAADKLARSEELTDHEIGFWRGQKSVAKSIRRSTEMPTIAPDAGTAELAKLRGERVSHTDILEVMKIFFEGCHGDDFWQMEHLEEHIRESFPVPARVVDDAEAERDTLAASLAQANLRAKNAYMRGLLDSAQHLRSTIPDKPEGWEQVESMARMLDAMATREAARHIAEGQGK